MVGQAMTQAHLPLPQGGSWKWSSSEMALDQRSIFGLASCFRINPASYDSLPKCGSQNSPNPPLVPCPKTVIPRSGATRNLGMGSPISLDPPPQTPRGIYPEHGRRTRGDIVRRLLRQGPPLVKWGEAGILLVNGAPPEHENSERIPS